MPELSQSLKPSDLGYLRMVAELWGVDLEAPDASRALPILIEAILDRDLVAETIDILPPDARAALDDLVAHAGRLPWALFCRRYGVVREMGPGRRDRERPHRTPVSPAEMLWYRALVARAFFDDPSGPQEFAYIPDDLMTYLPRPVARETPRQGAPAPGRPATAAERTQPRYATDLILDDACTYLAARRMGLPEGDLSLDWTLPLASLAALLKAAGLLDERGLPVPEASRRFLEMPRGTALAHLAGAWLDSERFNDLLLIPHLQAEGAWVNDPRGARRAILGFIREVPPDSWWSLSALVQAVREVAPDFQRPAGDYDSWFIRDRRTGAYLRGFEHWDAVDGELIRYLIAGPLHWLGILDLAAPESGEPVTAFRWTAWAAQLLEGESPAGFAIEDEAVHVRSDGQVTIPPLAPRKARYQIARFCDWEGMRGGRYRYRLTPGSLQRARDQGLRVGHLLALMERFAETVPPNLVKALDRWERNGVEARLEQVSVLRLGSPDLLKALRSSRAGRFLGTPLGPTAVIVKEGAGEKVLAILAEMGYLGNVE